MLIIGTTTNGQNRRRAESVQCTITNNLYLKAKNNQRTIEVIEERMKKKIGQRRKTNE